MSSSPPLRIAIVGGGIAGLSAALALLDAQKAGANIKLDVYEQTHQFAEIGAGVAFGPNAQRALKLMGLSDALTATIGVDEDEPDLWFEVSVGMKGKDEKRVLGQMQGHDAAKGSVHRADFLDQLIHRLPVENAHFDHHCTHTTPHDGGITMHFSGRHGQPGAADAEADVVIASDGINSSLRGHLYDVMKLPHADQQARYSEWIAWRGLVPLETFYSVFGQGVENKRMVLGKDKHILTFPVKNGSVINIVAFFRDPSHAKLGSHTGPWSEVRPTEEMLEDFADFSQDYLHLLKVIEKPSIWGIFELPEIKTTLGDRLILIGDAAHATTPHQGSGAGQAVEDALFISRLLTHPSVISSKPETIKAALEQYVKSRHERGWLVQKTSHEAGLIYEFCGPEEGDDVEKIMETLSHRMQWIWEWDTEAELKKALDALA